MKKRILALSLAAAMLVGAMASCSAKEEVVSSQVEQRDFALTIWGSENDQDWLKETTAEWAKDFQSRTPEAKSVTVDVKIVGEDKAATEALNDLAAAADVFGIAHDNIGQLANSQAIFPIQGQILDDIKASVGERLTETTFYEGTYYGFPYSLNTANILFYNKEMYTEDEVKDLNVMLEKQMPAGMANVAHRITNGWDGMTWLASGGGELFTNNDKTINTLNNEGCVKALAFVSEQIKAGKIIFAEDNIAGAGMLKDGLAAAFIFQSWASNDFKDALGDNFGVAELPMLNGQHMKCFGGSKLYVINAQTKEPEAAADLCKYLTSEQGQLSRFKNEKAHTTPCIASLLNNPDVAADPIVYADMAQDAYTITNCPYVNLANYWKFGGGVLTELNNGTLTDEATIQTKLNEMVQAMTDALNA